MGIIHMMYKMGTSALGKGCPYHDNSKPVTSLDFLCGSCDFGEVQWVRMHPCFSCVATAVGRDGLEPQH